MNTPIPAPDREELIKLRQQGLNREQIAKHYGVALSRVKRWVSELDLPEVPARASKREKIKFSEGVPLSVDHGLTIIEQAQNILGPRMTEDRNRGYLLDGRLVRIDILLRAAGLAVPENK